MYSNIQESTSNLFYGMFTFALKKMLRIFIWKNSILRFMETLKYLIIYQFWSNYFATLRWNNSNFTLEWNLMRQNGAGRSVEGVAKGFGTRRQYVLF